MRRTLSLICKGLITALVLLAWGMMLFRGDGMLAARGLWSLKYFTVLSNLLCALAALLCLCLQRRGGRSWLDRLYAASVAAVMLTFLTVVVFLGPIFGYAGMYRGGNLFFHLIVPLLAMADFALLDPASPLSRAATLWVMAPPGVYGVFYLGNILINGAGAGPSTNDWYGFARWGIPVGIGIFAVILLITYGAALLLRRGKLARQKSTEPKTEVTP